MRRGHVGRASDVGLIEGNGHARRRRRRTARLLVEGDREGHATVGAARVGRDAEGLEGRDCPCFDIEGAGGCVCVLGSIRLLLLLLLRWWWCSTRLGRGKFGGRRHGAVLSYRHDGTDKIGKRCCTPWGVDELQLEAPWNLKGPSINEP